MPLIRSKDVELFYDLTGPEGAPVVAFSNSIGTTLEMWDRQVPALSDRYRCVRYDTRGHGRSPVFAMPWHDFITRTAWGEVWGDPTLPRKVRSFVTLAMMVALHREEEFKLHVRPALRNGVTLDELQALLLQTAIYAGVPATNAAFRWVKEVLGDEMT